MAKRRPKKLFAVDSTFHLALFGELFVFFLLPPNRQGGWGGGEGGGGGRTARDRRMHAYVGLVPVDSRVMVRAVVNKTPFARFSRISVLEKRQYLLPPKLPTVHESPEYWRGVSSM